MKTSPNKHINMYTTLIAENGSVECKPDSSARTFLFKVISSTDSSFIPGSKIAAAVICSLKMDSELIIGSSYGITITDNPLFKNVKVADLLADHGKAIQEHNKSESIFWVEGADALNPYFIAMAEVKLGIAEFPMKKLDVNHPTSSSYGVISDHKKREEETGELVNSGNYSSPINNDDDMVTDLFGIYVDTTSSGYYNNEYEGYRMVVYNAAGLPLEFPSIDGRILLLAQAQDQNGIWRNIEKVSFSDCGLSYYNVFLNQGKQWRFAAPVPKGAHPTKLRMSLYVKVAGEQKVIYSNTYSGSINWGQLVLDEKK